MMENYIFSYCQNYYYMLISINLSRQAIASIPQQITFTRKLKDDGATKFFIVEKQKKIFLNFFFRLIYHNRIV